MDIAALAASLDQKQMIELYTMYLAIAARRSLEAAGITCDTDQLLHRAAKERVLINRPTKPVDDAVFRVRTEMPAKPYAVIVLPTERDLNLLWELVNDQLQENIELTTHQAALLALLTTK